MGNEVGGGRPTSLRSPRQSSVAPKTPPSAVEGAPAATPTPTPPDAAGDAGPGNMGLVFGRQGDLDRAMEHYRKALAIRLKALAPDPDAGATYSNMANVFEELCGAVSVTRVE